MNCNLLRNTLLITFLTCFITFDALTQNEQSKRVSGAVTYQGQPLFGVNVTVVGQQRGVVTDTLGTYSIKVKTGEELQYSYVGFKKIRILIEDITTVLNIKLDSHINELDEVSINVKNKIKKEKDYYDLMNVDIQTSLGIINPSRSASAVHYLNNRDLRSIGSPTLEDALNGRFSRVVKEGEQLFIRGNKANFDIDGQLYGKDPGLIFSNIEHLYIIKEKALVIIRTKRAPEVIDAKRKKIAAQYTNKNYYQDDAQVVNDELKLETPIAKNEPSSFRQITGVITFLDEPLRNVHVVILESKKGSKTDKRGNYKIKAKVGQRIQYSHIGYKTVIIRVEDVTAELSFEMIPKTNELDEIIVTAKSIDGKTMQLVKKAEREFKTSRGSIDPRRAGYSVGYVDGEDLTNVYASLQEALRGKISGYEYDAGSGKSYMRGKNSSITQDYPVAWEVDGVFTQTAPIALDLSQIKDVFALKTLAATNKYGTAGAGGVIVIQTKNGGFDANSYRKKIADKFTNKNFYSNDAVAFSEDKPSYVYIDSLIAINNSEKAFAYYENKLKSELQNYDAFITISSVFVEHYKAKNVGLQVLNELKIEHQNNPEILKAIAFYLQDFGLKKEAIKTYQQIYKLRPSYAQSFRDLANAHTENEQFVKAWRIYMTYLFKGNDVSDEGIGELLYNEMEWLYFNRSNQTAIKQQFVPKNETIDDFRNDVRMVFEWNTSEAEFDLEFVNPERQVYVFEHSLAKNEDLIDDEKKKGYSSKEFFIDDLGTGEWLVNLTYLGNKKPEPTYFKISKYYHWGKPNQWQEIAIYKFDRASKKIQLYTFNEQSLVVRKF